jgi:DnaK suppressor protein
MDHLTTAQRDALAHALTQRRQGLQRRRQAHQHGLSRVEYASELLAQDSDDAPQRAGERELDIALSEIELLELAAVDQALARMKSGHYGRCIDCDANIPLARLEVEPDTQRCVGCQSLHEKKEHLP